MPWNSRTDGIFTAVWKGGMANEKNTVGQSSNSVSDTLDAVGLSLGAR